MEVFLVVSLYSICFASVLFVVALALRKHNIRSLHYLTIFVTIFLLYSTMFASPSYRFLFLAALYIVYACTQGILVIQRAPEQSTIEKHTKTVRGVALLYFKKYFSPAIFLVVVSIPLYVSAGLQYNTMAWYNFVGIFICISAMFAELRAKSKKEIYLCQIYFSIGTTLVIALGVPYWYLGFAPIVLIFVHRFLQE